MDRLTKRWGLGLPLFLLVACSATEPSVGHAPLPVRVASLGDEVSLSLDAYHAQPAPLELSAPRGFLPLNHSTETLRASLIARAGDTGEYTRLDDLLRGANVQASLWLDFDDGSQVELLGRPLLTQIEFDLEGREWPAGHNAIATLRVGAETISCAEVFRAVQPGDANGDGIFDSADMVAIFTAGKYETGEAATFEEGDFNGDGVANSNDLVEAVTFGYEVPAARLPNVPDLLVRDVAPGWFTVDTVIDGLDARLDAILETLDAGDLTVAERIALEDALERTEELMYNPPAPEELAEAVGCAVDCWLTATESEEARVWHTDRGRPTCEAVHDDDCRGVSSGGTTTYPLECDAGAGTQRDGWSDGVSYQYNACTGDSVGTSDFRSTCSQEVSLSLVCERYGPTCDDHAAAQHPPVCRYEPRFDAQVQVGGGWDGEPGGAQASETGGMAQLPTGQRVTGRLFMDIDSLEFEVDGHSEALACTEAVRGFLNVDDSTFTLVCEEGVVRGGHPLQACELYRSRRYERIETTLGVLRACLSELNEGGRLPSIIVGMPERPLSPILVSPGALPRGGLGSLRVSAFNRTTADARRDRDGVIVTSYAEGWASSRAEAEITLIPSAGEQVLCIQGREGAFTSEPSYDWHGTRLVLACDDLNTLFSEEHDGRLPEPSPPVLLCPPPVTASPSCGGSFTPGGPNCTPDGVLTPEGERVVDQCNSAGSEQEECGYYLQVRQCFDDCSECERDRLVGYFQTCRNMTQIATGNFRIGGSCRQSCALQEYTTKMRRCLQTTSQAELAEWNGDDGPLGCTEAIEGVPGNIDSGIIGSHTMCNRLAGFCDLAPDDMSCFGMGIGDSWGGVCGNDSGHTAYGSFTSVGICHMMSQALTCGLTADAGVGSMADFQNALCEGYQEGCMGSQPQCTLYGGETGERGAGSQELACKLACPTTDDLALIASLGMAIPAPVAEFMDLLEGVLEGRLSPSGLEAQCESIFGRDIVPGVSCDEPEPSPTSCCCTEPDGQVTYSDPDYCAARGGAADLSTCNLRDWTAAHCTAPPPPTQQPPRTSTSGDDEPSPLQCMR